MGDRFGEVSERFKEPVLKTGDSVMGHGFESHPLRHTTLKQNGDHQFCLMEKYSSGRRGAPAKGVGVLKRARVQIPPSPPRKRLKPPGFGRFSLFSADFSVKKVTALEI